ncbi:uncharacterized protein [Rutidosis leptorrhynchoides]|uniref:uncharacterized protein n=1 Tax=Rutidosis leptorrhynchoides TaxID=125765 RepID=UPI003A998ABF
MRGRALDELNKLNELLFSVPLFSMNEDEWVWNLNVKGAFKAKFLTRLIDKKYLVEKGLLILLYCYLVSPKINIFVWRLSLDKLATRSSLMKRGVTLGVRCTPLLRLGKEDIDHIFLNCRYIIPLWKHSNLVVYQCYNPKWDS